MLRVGPIINEVVKSRSFTYAPTRVVPTDPAGDPRLRGTIALALQNTSEPRRSLDLSIYPLPL